MIKFDLLSNKDANGFIRLDRVPNFSKFIEVFNRMGTTTPVDPNTALYKNYNVTVYGANGVSNFAAMSQAEMFIKRIKKYLPTGWVIWSTTPRSYGYCDADKKRINLFYYIYNYEFVNLEKPNTRSLKIYYLDINNKLDYFYVNVSEFDNIIFKPLTEAEVDTYKNYIQFINQKPAPIYRLMIMKEDYKTDYQMYLTDCAEYGFKPLDKSLIERISVGFKGVATTFTEDGKLGWAPGDEDTVIVNEYPE